MTVEPTSPAPAAWLVYRDRGHERAAALTGPVSLLWIETLCSRVVGRFAPLSAAGGTTAEGGTVVSYRLASRGMREASASRQQRAFIIRD